MNSRTSLAAAAAALALAACGGADPGTGPGSDIVTVSMSPNTPTLVFGETRQLALRDMDGQPVAGVTWVTSASTVATVSPAGVLTGVGDGSATITGTSRGSSGSVTVTVVTLALASVATGDAHTCALTATGAGYCWGRGEYGQLGATPPHASCSIEAENYACRLAPVAVQGGLAFAQVDAGSTHTCALTSAGSAYCWGRNNAGQLGDNSTTNRFDDQKSAPAAVAGGLVFTSLSAASLHACGLTAAGTAYCWGANSAGQLGDGTTTNRPVPVAVTGGLSFAKITTGGYARGLTCGLTISGAAYCWGENVAGQLGIGTTDDIAHPVPTPVSGGFAFASLAAGTSHVCGLTSAGSAYCWGANAAGALGDGTLLQRSAPVAVTGGIAFAQIVAGGFSNLNAHTCGLTGSGQAYCWGDNQVGAIGDGSTVNRLAPSALAGQSSFISLAAGSRHTCGLATTGILHCWGSNGAGQLGVNSVTMQSAPARVIGQR